jgi:hypothetical protein
MGGRRPLVKLDVQNGGGIGRCATREGRVIVHAACNAARNVAASDAFDAAVKIAFLSAFRTESHARYRA